MTLLAAWMTLLHRFSGQDDLVVGTAVANRNRAETEDLIGFFVNSLALYCSAAGNPEFGEMIDRVRETALDAYAHQDLPFEKLVEELRPARDLSRNPLFQVAFTVQNVPRRPTRLGDLTLRALPSEVPATRFDLEMHLGEDADGFRLVSIYDRDLFDRTTVRRLGRWYQTVLEGVVEDPSRSLSAVPMLSAADLHQLLVEWNDTPSTAAGELTIPQLFAAQVEARPEAVAVVAAEGALSYRELDVRSNRLAQRLRALGVGPDLPRWW